MVDSLSKPSSVILEDGRHVVLKVNRNEDFEMPSRVNPCLKYSIFALSYVLLIIAIGLLSLGFWAQIEKSGIIFHLHKFDPSKVMAMFEPTVLIIITGLIILVISFCGTVGSLRDNCFYLTVYTSVLGCLVLTFFLLFALTGISGQVLFTAIKTAIDDTIIRYRDDPDLQLFVDWIQINLKCCGSRSPHDWNDNIYFSDAKTLHRYGSPEAGGVPFSCCKEDKSEILRNLYCGLGARIRPIDAEIGARGPYVRDNIYNQGCIEMLKQFLINNALYIVPGVTIFLLIQLFCVFLACILQNQILVQREEWYSTEHLKVFVYDA